MQKRGALFMVWGEKHEGYLSRAARSVRQHHPDLPIHIHRLGEGASLLDKASMAEVTPFDTTLFLDVDTVTLGRLDFGFEQAERHGLACCICEAPWARRYPSIRGDVVEYNTGVLFWNRAAKPVFDRWNAIARDIDCSITMQDGRKMAENDQAGFAAAVNALHFNPFVLPLNWNFRPQWHKSWWGALRVWHDYRPVPPSLIEFNQDQDRDDAILRYCECR